LKDDHGYVTSLTDYPDRIISLAPSNTEILFELGLGDKVVAVTDYCDYPYNFSEWITTGNMTSIGAFENPNMEVIATLDPDLIFATGGVQEEAVASLRELGNKVLVLDPATVDDVLQDIILVGKATDRNQEAQSIVDDLRSRIDAVVNKVAAVASKPKVYYEIWYDPTSLWVAGSEAWQNELIEKAGGINIFADQQLDYFQSSAEAVIERNPDLILLPGGHGFGPPFWESFDAVKARPGWDSITAVQNNELYKIDQNLIARAGTRVADAIEILAEFFHPQLF
jgi:iron complex transport system substrate-binding protein